MGFVSFSLVEELVRLARTAQCLPAISPDKFDISSIIIILFCFATRHNKTFQKKKTMKTGTKQFYRRRNTNIFTLSSTTHSNLTYILSIYRSTFEPVPKLSYIIYR